MYNSELSSDEMEMGLVEKLILWALINDDDLRKWE